MQQDFGKFLAQSLERLNDIKQNPYPEPAIDSVTVAMLIEKANRHARKAGCGDLTMPREELEKHRSPVDPALLTIEAMLAWWQQQPTV